MTFQAYHSPLKRQEGDFWLRTAARQHWEMAGESLLIKLDEMEQLADEHSTTSVAQNVAKLLNYIVRRSPRPSTDVSIRFETDYTVVDALEPGELAFYLGYLCDAGLITQTGAFGAPQHDRRSYRLTVQGWGNLEQLDWPLARHTMIAVSTQSHRGR